MPDVGSVKYKVEADIKGIDKDIDKVEKTFKDSGEDIEKASQKTNDKVSEDFDRSSQKSQSAWKKAGSTIAKGIGAAFATVGGAAVTAAGMAIKGAANLDSAANQFISSTGIAAEQTLHLADGTTQMVDNTEKYGNIIKDIYANNYGEGFEDIANAMAEVHKQMAYLDETDLQNITESAFVLRDTFGYEVTESVRAANSLVDQFGIDADQAMNLIAQGAQNGLDYSGELLDLSLIHI